MYLQCVRFPANCIFMYSSPRDLLAHDRLAID